MEVDVAVLGGGPGGYTAAIRAAQLGAKAVCIELEPELGGTCLRVGCIPTKAWVQTAHALHQADEVFAKFGVNVSKPELDFGTAVEWKNGVVKQMTGGIASLFKANGVEWVKGKGRFKDANTIAVEGGEDVTFKQAIVATGSFPIMPPIEGLDSPRCVDSTGLLAQTEIPRRLVVLGGGIIGCEFASIFQRFGSEVTIVEMLDTLIPQEDADAAKELAKAFGKRGIALQLGKQCTRVDDDGSKLTVALRRRRDRCEADLMLVSRRPRAARRRARARGDRRRARQAQGDRHRRAPAHDRPAHLRGRRLRRLLAARPHRVPRGRGRGRERLRPRGDDRRSGGAAADLHRSGDRGRRPDRGAGARAARRRRRGRRVPWVANARAVMQAETVGWVKSIHETKYGELLGIVMVGPHVTDLIEAGTVAIDAESTVETVADGMAAHPTLSEAIKEAGSSRSAARSTCPNKKRAAAKA